MDPKSKVTAMHTPNTYSLIKRQLSQSSLHKLIKEHGSDKHSKGFDTYRHLLVMILAQLTGSKSLRELEFTVNSHHSHHYHLGLSTIKRSTLSYANEHRPVGVFADLLQSMLHKIGRKQKSEINDLIYLLDSTSITLKGHKFDDWTMATRTRNTQGLKLHVEYSPKDDLATFFKITPANINDVSVGREVPLRTGATYVFDKGYCDYDWWLKIDENNIFVTRLKRNAAIQIIENRAIKPEISGVIKEDAIFCLSNKHPRAGKKLRYTKPLRRIEVARADKETPLILVTNDLDRDPLIIAELYKSRWLIELFFKWIKQNLKIKHFLGRSENAVQTQIITALIAYTLVATLHQQLPIYESLREMLLMLKTRLFQKLDFEKPPPMRQRIRTTNPA